MSDFDGVKNTRHINAPDFVVTNGRAQPKRQAKITPKVQSDSVKPKQKQGGILNLLDLSNMAMDSDRSIVLMMLALLTGNQKETDELLIMALLYIML